MACNVVNLLKCLSRNPFDIGFGFARQVLTRRIRRIPRWAFQFLMNQLYRLPAPRSPLPILYYIPIRLARTNVDNLKIKHGYYLL